MERLVWEIDVQEDPEKYIFRLFRVVPGVGKSLEGTVIVEDKESIQGDLGTETTSKFPENDPPA